MSAIEQNNKIETWSTLDLVEFRRHSRQRLIKIRHQTVVGDLKDRRLLIFVDGNNHLEVFMHTRDMLNGTGNSYRDVKFGCDDLACLPNLPIVRCIACVNCCARSANRRPQFVSNRLYIFGEVFRLCMARPPEIMIFADVSSGRSDFESCSPTNVE